MSIFFKREPLQKPSVKLVAKPTPVRNIALAISLTANTFLGAAIALYCFGYLHTSRTVLAGMVADQDPLKIAMIAAADAPYQPAPRSHAGRR